METMTHTSFPITFGSIKDFFEKDKPKLQNECVRAPKTADGGRNLIGRVMGVAS